MTQKHDLERKEWYLFQQRLHGLRIPHCEKSG